MRIHMRTYTCAYKRIHTHVCTYVNMHVHIHSQSTYIGAHQRACTYTRIHMHIHARKGADPRLYNGFSQSSSAKTHTDVNRQKLRQMHWTSNQRVFWGSECFLRKHAFGISKKTRTLRLRIETRLFLIERIKWISDLWPYILPRSMSYSCYYLLPYE